MFPKIHLKPNKEKAIRQKHPWIFSGAIHQDETTAHTGDIVQVYTHNDEWIGYGYFNPLSKIAIRMLTWDKTQIPNETWWKQQISNAIQQRLSTNILQQSNTYRLIHGEADGLPGLIVDKYDQYLSIQCLTAGIEQQKTNIIKTLSTNFPQLKGIFERSDTPSRHQEGLTNSIGVLWGEKPPETFIITENNINYHINITEGQKSGFYCDQRENRKIVAQYCSEKNILDTFCYTGGFTLNALQHQAKHITSVDSSTLALETLQKNITLNHFDIQKNTIIKNDVNKQLRIFHENKQTFDVIILDPPKLAPTRSSVQNAQRAYKDLNLNGLKLLKKGGLLVTFSCSAGIDMALFKQIIAWAALDANKEIQIIHQFTQPADHPIRTTFPESEYLKGLLCMVTN